jgi:hypothetical protein
VYLVRGSVLSLSFVEPHKRERPKKPDEPAPRHAPRNVGLQDLVLIPRISRWSDSELRSEHGPSRSMP